jgi:hypothetical protein
MSSATQNRATVSHPRRLVPFTVTLFAFAAAPALLAAQDIPGSPATFSSSQPDSSLPDAPQQPSAPAPQDKSSDAQTPASQNKQTSRILGILPNFRAVSTDVHLPAQSVKEKFVTASEDSFDYSSIFVPIAVAAVSYERNSTPEFGTGGVGYGRYLWHTVVDQTQENFFVEFIVPAATHEDTRFYTLGHGSFAKRAGYALSRVVVTRSDAGTSTFNFGEVLGSGMSAGLSNAYYPTRERSFSNTGSQWGLNIAVDALAFVVKEFWPDINHHLFHSGNQSASSASTPATR